MKRLVAAFAAALTLSACGGAGTGNTAVDSRMVPLPDGRSVTCVVSDGSYSGGVDCDWDRTR